MCSCSKMSKWEWGIEAHKIYRRTIIVTTQLQNHPHPYPRLSTSDDLGWRGLGVSTEATSADIAAPRDAVTGRREEGRGDESRPAAGQSTSSQADEYHRGLQLTVVWAIMLRNVTFKEHTWSWNVKADLQVYLQCLGFNLTIVWLVTYWMILCEDMKMKLRLLDWLMTVIKWVSMYFVPTK